MRSNRVALQVPNSCGATLPWHAELLRTVPSNASHACLAWFASTKHIPLQPLCAKQPLRANSAPNSCKANANLPYHLMFYQVMIFFHYQLTFHLKAVGLNLSFKNIQKVLLLCFANLSCALLRTTRAKKHAVGNWVALCKGTRAKQGPRLQSTNSCFATLACEAIPCSLAQERFAKHKMCFPCLERFELSAFKSVV